ncbi:MAG: hypothetical protein HQ492_12260 [Woeseiaceae bacterium]|nr:hypothetical protein [Woeseiaceae bacterium]
MKSDGKRRAQPAVFFASANGGLSELQPDNAENQNAISNSRPDLGVTDLLVIADGVAFVTGVVVTIDDRDYFSVVLAADATVRAELSHFDLLTNDLDLEILDENLVQLAFSNSSDGFETAEAQLQAGDTCYVGVMTSSEPSEASYILSIDVN